MYRRCSGQIYSLWSGFPTARLACIVSRGLGLVTATTSAAFVAHFEQRIQCPHRVATAWTRAFGVSYAPRMQGLAEWRDVPLAEFEAFLRA